MYTLHHPHPHTHPSHHWVCTEDVGENIPGLPQGSCYNLDFHGGNNILLQESDGGDLGMESDDGLEETVLSILEMSDLGLESDILLQIPSILVSFAILESSEGEGILLEVLPFPLPSLLSLQAE